MPSSGFASSSTYDTLWSLHPPPSLVNSHQGCCQMSDEEMKEYSRYVSPLMNGYCRDTASILGVNNLDLLSPLLALEHEEAFPIVRSFLEHLLKEYNMVSICILAIISKENIQKTLSNTHISKFAILFCLDGRPAKTKQFLSSYRTWKTSFRRERIVAKVFL